MALQRFSMFLPSSGGSALFYADMCPLSKIYEYQLALVYCGPTTDVSRSGPGYTNTAEHCRNPVQALKPLRSSLCWVPWVVVQPGVCRRSLSCLYAYIFCSAHDSVLVFSNIVNLVWITPVKPDLVCHCVLTLTGGASRLCHNSEEWWTLSRQMCVRVCVCMCVSSCLSYLEKTKCISLAVCCSTIILEMGALIHFRFISNLHFTNSVSLNCCICYSI